MFYLIGLGNPEEQYVDTRHNLGRELVKKFCRQNNFSDFVFDKKSNSLIAKGKVGRESVTAVLPQTFMNHSGRAVAYFVKNKKQAEKILVAHDDIDLVIGHYKVQFNRGSGGNKGVESIHQHLKTQSYPRLKIGICPITPSGKNKKPNEAEKVIKHVLGEFSPKEKDILKKNNKNLMKVIEAVIADGYLSAMNKFN